MTPVETARHIAALPQERGGDFEFTVREIVAMGRTPYQRAFAGRAPPTGRWWTRPWTRWG